MRSLRLVSFLITLFFTPTSFAVDGIMLSYGQGMNDVLIQYKDISGATHKSAGVFWNTNYSFNHDFLGYSELEVEAYFSEIKKEQTIDIIAVRPILNFWGTSAKDRSWYWQFGVGLSYFDSKRLDPVELSTNGQFATIFGLGMPLDDTHKHRLTLRYNHYSNAYIKTPNQGIDTLSLDWHYRF